MTPFSYPPTPIERRHGPQGYRDLESYRPWLRDDFLFRCVFCLRREQWDRATTLHIDHYLPTNQHPLQTLSYANLLFACSRCNLAKSDQATPDPCVVLLADALIVQATGHIAGASDDSRRMIAQLRLHSPEVVHFRRLWLEIIAMAQRDPNLVRTLMGFPSNLPDLARLRPPGGNRLPQGITQSHRARRNRGELPELY